MFNGDVTLPAGLEISAIGKSIEFVERELSQSHFIDIYLEQANLFSAIVGVFGTRALDSVSNYEKHPHSHTAQQRFPDLSRRGADKDALRPQDSLESKASLRAWPVQSHYDHEGRYIVWRYLVDLTRTIAGREVVIWRVDVAYIRRGDWKYESSKAGQSGGGRTHTFGLRKPASFLKGCAVYQRPNIVLRTGKPVPNNGF